MYHLFMCTECVKESLGQIENWSVEKCLVCKKGLDTFLRKIYGNSYDWYGWNRESY